MLSGNGRRPDDWQGDLKWSDAAFMRLIAPRLLARWGGRIHPVQTEQDALKLEMDRQAGIDFYHQTPGGALRGVACRVQIGNYQTFTVRQSRRSGAKTEYAKLSEAIQSGSIYPYWSVQGYVTEESNDGELSSFAVCRTALLIAKIDAGQCYSNGTDNASFYVVNWGDWCEMVYVRQQEPPVTPSQFSKKTARQERIERELQRERERLRAWNAGDSKQ